MNQSEFAISIRLDDGRTIVATPRPEDQDRLAQAGIEAQIALYPSDADTEGHGISNEISVDVEGHALTLRLPNAHDAETLRRMLMAGALSATVIAAGAIASMQSPAQPTMGGGEAGLSAPQAQQVNASSDVGLADLASRAATDQWLRDGGSTGAGGGIQPATSAESGTSNVSAPSASQAEQNSDVGIADLAVGSGTATGTGSSSVAAPSASQAEQDRDLGFADLAVGASVQTPSTMDNLQQQREDRIAEVEAPSGTAGSTSQAPGSGAPSDTPENRSGPQEFDR